MKKTPTWIAKLFADRKMMVLHKPILEKILPHRGRWLLLDSVRFIDGKATGEFVLTKEICDGHVIAGILMAPGCIWLDAAAQLLGIIVHQDEEIIARVGTDKTLAALAYNGAEFRRRICPGEKVLIETSAEVDYEDSHGFFRIIGGMFFIRVDGEKKVRAKIASVTLTPVSFEDMK